ncbi:hypothetical protein L1O03_03910 [Corynebacterium uropygiale]|uniref:Uncharacterized protein n=1 Tax=Corynebacterium uropygiale TaxID=1775911 RepID=A0A9X1QQF7_9CORY|nr:hypothetical protein [Corynebacterium uropygiale]MCF4006325.1 hypothetical protein [Corynebacterium uropygiale]
MPALAIVAADSAGSGSSMSWLVYLLFLVAGLMVGGTWSMYQAGNKVLTIVFALIAAVSLVGAILWLIGVMS